MPEVLGDAGLYFDPERPATIADALERLAWDPRLREQLAARAYERAARFSWDRCARETFAFLAEVATSWRARAGGTARRSEASGDA